MRIHTVFVTYNRLELTKLAIESYMDTVSVPYTYVVVDNASTDGTRKWLKRTGLNAVFQKENRYPGHACNLGWSLAGDDVDVLHRADNDFRFLPGWCETLAEALQNPMVGQVGLRTAAEEMQNSNNVGGNCVIIRELWDLGLRYDERPWGHPEIPKGWTEDSLLSPAVREMGFEWTRVARPCIVPTSTEDPNDPYYAESWRRRGIRAPGKMARQPRG